MGKLWHRILPSESFIKKNMQGCTGQPFFTANNVSDFHQMVVYNVGKVIGGQSVSAFVKHFIIKNIALDNDFTTNHIINMHLFTGYYFKTHHILCAVFNQLVGFFF